MHWRRTVVLVMVGCGRIDFDPQTAPMPGDAPGSAAPMLLETITVQATGEIETSSTSLAAGVTYRLVASGTCDIGGVPPLLDADWNFDSPETIMNDLGDNGLTDVGLGIDDTTIDGDKSPKWGPYRHDHVYTVDFVGQGAPITAEVHDAAFGNNSGTLTLEIYL
jgi:hypothetical protein